VLLAVAALIALAVGALIVARLGRVLQPGLGGPVMLLAAVLLAAVLCLIMVHRRVLQRPPPGGCNRLWPSKRRRAGRRGPVRRPAAGPARRVAAPGRVLARRRGSGKVRTGCTGTCLERPAAPPALPSRPPRLAPERAPLVGAATGHGADSSPRQVRYQWLASPVVARLTNSPAVTLVPAATFSAAATGEQPAGLPRLMACCG